MKVDEIPGKMRRKSKESLIWNSKFERQSPNQILVLERERERARVVGTRLKSEWVLVEV